MFLSFDKYVVSDPALRPHISVELDFVGFFLPNATQLTDCQTSSRWSECIVNAYHLCGMHVAGGVFDAWWPYSRCLYQKQYPKEECAGLNPLDANHTCSREEFPAIMRGVSSSCADATNAVTKLEVLDAAAIEQCVTNGTGLALLRRSFAKTTSFPRNPHGYTEPQWIEVDGPSCDTNFSSCASAFDKTHCADWDNCDSDGWAQHLAKRVMPP